MTIYVDDLMQYHSGTWCHMMTDQDDLTELHQMALRIGLKRSWFQNHPHHPHYDLRASKRTLAIQHGAIAIDSIELAKRCSKLFKNRPELLKPKRDD